MSFFLAPALVKLRGEIDAKYDGRDKSSDGWIGDPSHAARTSDHNPDWNAPGRLRGVVRATDTDNNGGSGERTPLIRDLLNAAVGDSRVWYVIYDRVIYSRTHGWAARRYTGSNPHDKHAHVSLRHGVGEFDRSPWLEPVKAERKAARKTRSRPISLSVVHNVFQSYATDPKGTSRSPRRHVARVQAALNRAGAEPRLAVDGVIGEETLGAWRRFERARKVGTGRPGVPDRESLRALLAPTYRIVE